MLRPAVSKTGWPTARPTPISHWHPRSIQDLTAGPEPVCAPALSSPYDGDAEKLPTNLHSAIEHFESSKLFRKRFGEEFTDYVSRLKRAEWQRYLMTVSEWEHAEYFMAY